MTGQLPEHLVPIGDGDFAMWRSFCVRRAGMPYDWIETPQPADFAAAHDSALAGLMRIADKPLFLEAVRWQNPRVAAQLRQERRGEYKRTLRPLRRTLAGYAQRYCAKNDTFGFFGPKSWGEWVDGDTRIGQIELPPRRGPAYLELWAVRALAEALEEGHGLFTWTVPHVAPGVRIAGAVAHLFDGSQLALTGLQQSVIDASDGFRTVGDVISDCAALGHPATAIQPEIRKLQMMGVLTRGFAISQSRLPERRLRMQLSRVGDPVAQGAALKDFDDLLSGVDQVSAALGDPLGQADALAHLDQVFSRVTGQVPRRKEGQYYAGRNIAFEDCAGADEICLGTSVLNEMAPALDLLLLSARWFSCAVAAQYLGHARAIMDEDPGWPAQGFPLPILLSKLADTFWNSPSSPAAEAAIDLRSRWTSILKPDGVRGCHVLSSAQLKDEVARRFAAPSPGWPTARWHSPDIMLAAGSADDIRAGRYLAVLGEMHATINSADSVLFLGSHPDQGAAQRWIDADMPSRIVPIYPLSAGNVNSCTGPPEWYHSPSYVYLGMGTDPPYQPTSARLLPIGTLTVHADGDRLVVRSRTDQFEADLAAVLDDYLGFAACTRFGLMEPRAYQPRILIDNMVVARETWRVPFDNILPQGNRLEHFFALGRALREDYGLPRLAFTSISGEAKPIYVDFENPLAADVFFSKVRRGRERVPGGEVVFTEMIPGPAELWLRDATGNRYTVEFRLVCVDGARYPQRSPAGVR
jgi:Lantibiotic dehydratase, N terminus